MGRTEKLQKLYAVIKKIDNEEDCAAFFSDLCTDKELEKMAERVYAAELLLEEALENGGRDNVTFVLIYVNKKPNLFRRKKEVALWR